MADNLNPAVCYYRTFKIKRTATQSQIVKAYKKAARLYDPARNKNANAAARYAQVQTAYAVLSSPYRRAEYDRARQYRTANDTNVMGTASTSGGTSSTPAFNTPTVSDGSTVDTPTIRPSTNGTSWPFYTFGGASLSHSCIRSVDSNGIVTFFTTNPRPPTLTSPTGGQFTTSEDGRIFTVTAGEGHTYILGGGQGTLNATGHRMTITSRGAVGHVNVNGDGVNLTVTGAGTNVVVNGIDANFTASGAGCNISVTGNGATCRLSGAGATFTANGDSARCDARGAGITFTAHGNSAHCNVHAAGVTFTTTGQGATYNNSSGSRGFTFRGNNNTNAN